MQPNSPKPKDILISITQDKEIQINLSTWKAEPENVSHSSLKNDWNDKLVRRITGRPASNTWIWMITMNSNINIHNNSLDFMKIKQRLQYCKHDLCVSDSVPHWKIINSQLVTPPNLPSVGVEALTHVTDISDLIWLVITPSYSFRAFHTSELQFQVLSW